MMSAYKNIIVEAQNGVAVLTLNNPESRNPMTEETKDENVRRIGTVVLRGNNVVAIVPR